MSDYGSPHMIGCIDMKRPHVKRSEGYGRQIYQYDDAPGVFFDEKCAPVSNAEAAAVGFDTTGAAPKANHSWVNDLTKDQLDDLARQIADAKAKKE